MCMHMCVHARHLCTLTTDICQWMCTQTHKHVNWKNSVFYDFKKKKKKVKKRHTGSRSKV